MDIEFEIAKIVMFYEWWADYLDFTAALVKVGEEPAEDGLLCSTLMLMLAFAFDGIPDEAVSKVSGFFLKNEHWRTVDSKVMAYWHLHWDLADSYEEAEEQYHRYVGLAANGKENNEMLN